MVRVRFFGLYRLDLKIDEMYIDAKNVNDLIKQLAEKFAPMKPKDFKDGVVFLNGEMIFKYKKKFRTPLKDGDEIMIMSPASGG